MSIKNLFNRALIGMAVVSAIGGSSSIAQAGIITIDVGGVASNDELNSPINENFQVNVSSFERVRQISWDVSLEADAPSFLDDITVRISNESGQFFDLQPGFNVLSFGMGSFSSLGWVDLFDLGLSFGTGASGMLNLQFFEIIDDFAGNADGRWLRGSSITLDVPEPSSIALVGLGLLASGGAASRRRRVFARAS